MLNHTLFGDLPWYDWRNFGNFHINMESSAKVRSVGHQVIQPAIGHFLMFFQQFSAQVLNFPLEKFSRFQHWEVTTKVKPKGKPKVGSKRKKPAVRWPRFPPVELLCEKILSSRVFSRVFNDPATCFLWTMIWLVVWKSLEHSLIFVHLLGMSSSQLTKSYFLREVGQPPTRWPL